MMMMSTSVMMMKSVSVSGEKKKDRR